MRNQDYNSIFLVLNVEIAKHFCPRLDFHLIDFGFRDCLDFEEEVAFSGTILATDTPLSTFLSLSYVNKKYAIVPEFKTQQLA